MQSQILDSLSMQIGVDDLMRSKLCELEKQRDQFDAKYETSRFEDMIGFGSESAFEAKQRELEDINRKKLMHDEKIRAERERIQEEQREIERQR